MTTLIAIYMGVVYTFGNFAFMDACQARIQRNVDNCPLCEIVWKCVATRGKP